MKKTGTVALLGYKQDVDWMQSASFEILLLSYLMKHPFNSVGVKKIKADIDLNCKRIASSLSFRMVLNERVWIKGTRKKS